MVAQTQLLTVLFGVLFGFVLLNIFINLILLLLIPKRLHKILGLYWPSVLLVFVLAGLNQQDPIWISLAYSASYLPVTFLSMLVFETLGQRFPLRRYLAFYALTIPATAALYAAGFGFTVYTLPLALGAAAPILHAFVRIWVIDREQSTRLQKLLGVILLAGAFHSLNFAFFRLEENAQLWGWIVSYALYDVLAILLPAMALEQLHLSEKDRLQQLVDERTAELTETSAAKDALLKVILHDLSNPLSVAKYFGSKVMPSEETKLELLKVRRSLSAMEDLLTQVKDRYSNAEAPPSLGRVRLSEAMTEVGFIFSRALEDKGLRLEFDDETFAGAVVLAERTTFIHSVLGNLVSNAIKFSPVGATIRLRAREELDEIVLELVDEGAGVSLETIERLLAGAALRSTQGTLGEKGSGFGLSIVKNYVQELGGQLQVENLRVQSVAAGGTLVRLRLPRASQIHFH